MTKSHTMHSVWYVCERGLDFSYFGSFLPPASSPSEAWQAYQALLGDECSPWWLDRKKHVAKRFTVTITPWEKP